MLLPRITNKTFNILQRISNSELEITVLKTFCRLLTQLQQRQNVFTIMTEERIYFFKR